MQFDILNLLQTLLLPLVVGAVVVGGLLVALVVLAGRKPAARRPATPAPAERPGPPAAVAAPAARQAGTVPAPRRQIEPALDTQTLPDTPPPAAATPSTALSTAPSTTPPATDPAAPALPWQADLLLVDDSAVVRAKLRRLFEPAGYRIALAHDGEAALGLLTHGRYGLLITDLEMPKLDGVGLIRAALALPACAGMPMLAITGHDDLQSQLNQLNAVAGIYRKPWVDDDLLGHVQTLVMPAAQAAEATLDA